MKRIPNSVLMAWVLLLAVLVGYACGQWSFERRLSQELRGAAEIIAKDPRYKASTDYRDGAVNALIATADAIDRRTGIALLREQPHAGKEAR